MYFSKYKYKTLETENTGSTYYLIEQETFCQISCFMTNPFLF